MTADGKEINLRRQERTGAAASILDVPPQQHQHSKKQQQPSSAGNKEIKQSGEHSTSMNKPPIGRPTQDNSQSGLMESLSLQAKRQTRDAI